MKFMGVEAAADWEGCFGANRTSKEYMRGVKRLHNWHERCRLRREGVLVTTFCKRCGVAFEINVTSEDRCKDVCPSCRHEVRKNRHKHKAEAAKRAALAVLSRRQYSGGNAPVKKAKGR